MGHSYDSGPRQGYLNLLLVQAQEQPPAPADTPAMLACRQRFWKAGITSR